MIAKCLELKKIWKGSGEKTVMPLLRAVYVHSCTGSWKNKYKESPSEEGIVRPVLVIKKRPIASKALKQSKSMSKPKFVKGPDFKWNE